MDVRSQIATLFHLDKCIGCHTCSVACKNVWTDRKGTEYMWWNNVETKPGTGYPTKWEDQEAYRGGFETDGEDLRLKSTSKARLVPNIFHNPSMPSMDDYYEPWTYRYEDLFNAPEGDDQPTAIPVSMITGEPIDVEAGPNWDDDLGGSPIYAANDPNLDALDPTTRKQMLEIERVAFFYLPRICNHCLNPSCVAACPSGALYKRGEDGVVLLNQQVCRGWRACVSACPYKKTYYNWATGKSEKCILCYPRLETGQAPACFHSCVGRIRYLGAVLYDADRIKEAALKPDAELVEAQRDLILDARDPEVAAAAAENGVPEGVIDAARRSPVFDYVKRWKLALPLHVEYRTFPMLFYVPPLLPVMATRHQGVVTGVNEGLFAEIDEARAPIAYLAKLFSAGNEAKVRYALKKQAAVRLHRRRATVGDVDDASADAALREADCTAEEADAIYRLTSLAAMEDRCVIPPMNRETAVEACEDPHRRRSEAGFGFRDFTMEV
jgi:nitrate reductase / nitrite oxidoreductase, beta subunit